MRGAAADCPLILVLFLPVPALSSPAFRIISSRGLGWYYLPTAVAETSASVFPGQMGALLLVRYVHEEQHRPIRLIPKQ